MAATRLLIGKLGNDTRTTHPRVHEELTNYGFWRNSLAIKPYAVISLVLLLLVHVSAAIAERDLTSVAFGAAITVLAMLYWISAVRPNRVRQHGETYACRLLETLDWSTNCIPAKRTRATADGLTPLDALRRYRLDVSATSLLKPIRRHPSRTQCGPRQKVMRI